LSKIFINHQPPIGGTLKLHLDNATVFRDASLRETVFIARKAAKNAKKKRMKKQLLAVFKK